MFSSWLHGSSPSCSSRWSSSAAFCKTTITMTVVVVVVVMVMVVVVVMVMVVVVVVVASPAPLAVLAGGQALQLSARQQS